MPDFAVVFPLVVATTFVVAAIGKWRHPSADAGGLADAGLPGWISSPFVRRWHPVAEVLLAVGLMLPAPWNVVPTGASLLLVVAYLAIVVVALRAPEPVACGCFGAEDTAPVSRWTLLRNLLLVLAAGLALADALLGGEVPGRLADPETWGWLAGTLVAVLLVLLAVDSGDSDSSGMDGTEPPAAGEETDEDDLADYVRAEIPEVTVLDPDGHPLSLRGLAGSGAQLLVFLSPGCGSCAGIARDLPRWRERQLPLSVRAVVHSQWVDSADTPVWLETALIDRDGDAARALGVRGTPGAVLLGADGLLAGGPVLGSRDVREFYVDIAGQLEAAVQLS